jgi:hypothetical protein
MRSGSVSRVLFDVNVAKSAAGFLTGHAVAFAGQRGWWLFGRIFWELQTCGIA